MRIPLCAAVLSALAGTAQAQWTATSLHPPGATSSGAYDVQSGRQVGWVVRQGEYQAAFWQGSAASMFTVQPAGSPESFLHDVSAAFLVGRVYHEGLYRASVWTSPDPEDWVDLTPLGASYSSALGIDGSRQVGEAMFSGALHAGMWTGTAASFIDLHPPGALWSSASAADNGAQVGETGAGIGVPHAAMWTGSPQSWVNLHPAVATQSRLFGVHAGRQVGEVWLGTAQYGAVWTSSPGSWQTLTAPDATQSIAWDTHNNVHVGYVRINGRDRASAWYSGTGGWVDLHSFLPAGFSDSYAVGIWSDQSAVSVVGVAHSMLSGRDEAMMWTRPAPPPPPPPASGYLYNNWDHQKTPAPEHGFNAQPFAASGAAAPQGSRFRESPGDGQGIFNSTIGFQMSITAGSRIADDFTIPAGEAWDITQMRVYTYQTGAPATPPTIEVVTLRIWNGPPNVASSQVVFGDETTNRMSAVEWTEIYNIAATVGCSALQPTTLRPIMVATCETPITLTAGTYWIDYAAAGSVASGPWTPAQVYSPNQRTRPSDNALQRASDVWALLNDAGQCGAPQGVPQDVSFEIIGTLVECASPPDFTTSAVVGQPGFGVPDNRVSSDDFFYYLLSYVEHEACSGTCPSPPDLTATAQPGAPGYGVPNGVVNAEDFFYYLDLYADGC